MSIEQLEKELEKKINSINPESDFKIKAMEFALQTTKFTENGLQVQLNGSSEIIEAAKKYYEFIKGTENAN